MLMQKIVQYLLTSPYPIEWSLSKRTPVIPGKVDEDLLAMCSAESSVVFSISIKYL